MTERNLREEALAAKGLEQGKLVIVRPSKLEQPTDGTTVVVASGVYEGAKPNKFNTAKNDYFVRGEDGTLYIINSTQSLEEQMKLLEGVEGATISIAYAGKKNLKSGRSVHDFTVLVK